MLALAPQPLKAHAEDAQSPASPEVNALPRELSQGASAVSQLPPSPTLPQGRKDYTQQKPKYSLRSNPSQYPQNNEDSSLHNAGNEKSSRSLVYEHGQHAPSAVELNSRYEHVGRTKS
jgi:hypothetical protein